MRDNFGGRLKTQLIIVFMVTITVVMGGMALIIYERVEEVVEKQSADITQQYFRQNEYNISNFATEVNNIMRSLIQKEEIASYIRMGWQDDFDVVMTANAVFDELTRIMGNYGYLESVFVYGDNGVVIGSNDKEHIVSLTADGRQDFYASEMYQNALDDPWSFSWYGTYDSDDFTGSDTMRKDPAVPYITMVGSINIVGRHAACVVINMREEELANMIGYSDEYRKRESFLVDEKGTVVVHRNADKLGTKFQLHGRPEMPEGGYFMQEDVQINFRELQRDSIPWMLISEVPVSILYRDIYSLRKWFMLTLLAAWLASWGISVYWLYRLTKPLDRLREAMSQMEQGNLGLQLEENSRNELGMLGRQFNRMSRSIEELVKQIQEVEEEKRLMEKEALQAQINPHFLFNTLSNIKYMAMIIKANTIVECITAFGNFLVPIYKDKNDVWQVKNEITYLQNYVKIMNYRFGGGINVVCDCPETVQDLYMLKFILQPLVENAIQHGFKEGEGKGTIRVSFQEEDGQVSIIVADDGCGMEAEELEELNRRLEAYGTGNEGKGGHIGLGNVHRRLRIYYGGEYGLTVASVARRGTEVCVRLPVRAGDGSRP